MIEIYRKSAEIENLFARIVKYDIIKYFPAFHNNNNNNNNNFFLIFLTKKEQIFISPS